MKPTILIAITGLIFLSCEKNKHVEPSLKELLQSKAWQATSYRFGENESIGELNESCNSINFGEEECRTCEHTLLDSLEVIFEGNLVHVNYYFTASSSQLGTLCAEVYQTDPVEKIKNVFGLYSLNGMTLNANFGDPFSAEKSIFKELYELPFDINSYSYDKVELGGQLYFEGEKLEYELILE
ncbi:hypothetical protein [Reichenbachiella ulvae]|uniref:Lipoprotein n=1 Tax=Reichenbachiella ulvae TaxID=2980104 RepID=A0ABT3CWL7_9BACT|nr:hypothetical protein [Reichenbachiella ulvae]MCV9388106.1 hypothetical protein [Reichenbachiella ulvae]